MVEDYKFDDIRRLQAQEHAMTGIHEVYGTELNKLGFNSVLSHTSYRVNSQKGLKDIVLAHIANPDRKKASVCFLSEQCGIMINLYSVYNAMDYIDDRAIDRI